MASGYSWLLALRPLKCPAAGQNGSTAILSRHEQHPPRRASRSLLDSASRQHEPDAGYPTPASSDWHRPGAPAPRPSHSTTAVKADAITHARLTNRRPYQLLWAAIFPIQTIVVSNASADDSGGDWLHYLFNDILLAIGIGLNRLGARLSERRGRRAASIACA